MRPVRVGARVHPVVDGVQVVRGSRASSESLCQMSRPSLVGRRRSRPVPVSCVTSMCSTMRRSSAYGGCMEGKPNGCSRSGGMPPEGFGRVEVPLWARADKTWRVEVKRTQGTLRRVLLFSRARWGPAALLVDAPRNPPALSVAVVPAFTRTELRAASACAGVHVGRRAAVLNALVIDLVAIMRRNRTLSTCSAAAVI